MIRRSHQFFSELVFAGVIAAGAASASPAFPAPPAETDAAIERTDWVQRCWWVDSPWGPRQQCRQVWGQPRYEYYDHGRGWAMATAFEARNGSAAVIGMTTTNGDNHMQEAAMGLLPHHN